MTGKAIAKLVPVPLKNAAIPKHVHDAYAAETEVKDNDDRVIDEYVDSLVKHRPGIPRGDVQRNVEADLRRLAKGVPLEDYALTYRWVEHRGKLCVMFRGYRFVDETPPLSPKDIMAELLGPPIKLRWYDYLFFLLCRK